MTKEEMLARNYIVCDAGEYLIDCDKAHAVMEEYANQQAVALAEFTLGWEPQVSRNREIQWRSKLPSVYGEQLRSTAELYQLSLKK